MAQLTSQVGLALDLHPIFKATGSHENPHVWWMKIQLFTSFSLCNLPMVTMVHIYDICVKYCKMEYFTNLHSSAIISGMIPLTNTPSSAWVSVATWGSSVSCTTASRPSVQAIIRAVLPPLLSRSTWGELHPARSKDGFNVRFHQTWLAGKTIGKWWFNGGLMGFYGFYFLVIQHGWLENTLFIGDLPIETSISNSSGFSMAMFDYQRVQFLFSDWLKT